MSSHEAAFARPISDDGSGCGDGENAAIADEIVRAGGRPVPKPMSAERERKVREDLLGFGLSPSEQRRRHVRSWVRQVRRIRYLPAHRDSGSRRPSRTARPRTSHALRRVASSRGDPDPGESEPPPPAQRRGEADADNLRLPLRADSPATAAFAAAYGHLSAHQQAMVDALAPAGSQDAYWAEIERDAARPRDNDRPRAAHRAALRPRTVRGILRPLPAHDPWEPWEPPLGLWRLRVLYYRVTAWLAGVDS